MSLRRTIAATLCAFTYHAILICCLAGCAEDRAEVTTNDPGVRLLESVAELATLPVGQGISPAAGYVPSEFATTYARGEDQTVRFANGPWDLPITTPVGTVIGGFGVALIDNATPNANTIKVELVSSIVGTIGGITSQGSGFEQAWTSSFANSRTTVGGEVLWFRCSPLLAGGGWATVNSTIESVSLWARTPTMTKVIAPGSGLPAYATLDITAGVGNVTANLDQHFSVGDRIRAIRLIVQDNTMPGAIGYSGPTELIARFKAYSPATGSVPTTLATSNTSNGSGTVQTLSITGLDVAVIGGGTTHSLQTIDYIGAAPTVVWSIEVDYIPAR